VFTTLDPVLEPNGDGTYNYHALWLQDNSPGVSLFGEGDSAMSPWVYATNPVITGIEDEKDGILRSFTLKQNFPNPFNPATQIEYSLPVSSKVSLIIYNLMGQEIARLVNGEQIAGVHSVRWDAAGLSSGIYFSRLRASGFVETKKMVLLK